MKFTDLSTNIDKRYWRRWVKVDHPCRSRAGCERFVLHSKHYSAPWWKRIHFNEANGGEFVLENVSIVLNHQQQHHILI